MIRRSLRALGRDRKGATIVEFALVLAPFLVLVMGTLDLGYQVYLRAMTSGALERAARLATVGGKTKAQVSALIRTEVNAVLPTASRTDAGAVTVTPLSYYNFSNVGGGERITSDTAPLGSYNPGDCYEDRNNNGHYDATGGGGDDTGGADDVVFYDVKVVVPRLFPLASTIGWGANVEVEEKTLIRNQPYGAQEVRTRCV